MASVSMGISGGLRRAESLTEFRGDSIGIRRSSSEPMLRCAVGTSKSFSVETKIKTNRSVGIFPLMEDSAKEMTFIDAEDDGDVEMGENAFLDGRKPVNWIDRLLELRRVWKDRRQKDHDGKEEVNDDDEGSCHCQISYDDDEEEFDSGSFSKYLRTVPWKTAKLFSKLAFLCNMSYRISDIKAEHLKTYYGLDLVTSSLAKKSKSKSKSKSATVVGEGGGERMEEEEPMVAAVSYYSYPPLPIRDHTRKRRSRPSIAYQIAASAASYVHSRAKGILSFGGEEENGEVAACMAASTMSAVVAVEETAKQEAAKDLQSRHSSPCEWFVCDDDSTCTRYFVTQGSDSLKSWQVNLLFEPTSFEGTSSLVHRGIYEAAKGLYEQFLPDIQEHLEKYGAKAKFRFTGHSLGGSLSLLVNLMLLSRGVVDRKNLLPVVTFGSPFVFCGGRTALTQLGFNEEEQLYTVMMHRDIVPRAFSCNYSDHVSRILKRLNGTFRSHPCLNKEKHLYSPLGKLFVLQPDEKFSPSHPFLPVGRCLYALDSSSANGALKAFLNSPHPLETLSDLKAYGSDGTILRDHHSGNYLKAVTDVLRERTRSVVVRRSRNQSLKHHSHPHPQWHLLEKALVPAEEVATGI